MRPGDFSPGNRRQRQGHTAHLRVLRFNEAGGFLPRKLVLFALTRTTVAACFNEAGGFLPRKLARPSDPLHEVVPVQLQ